MKAQPIDTAKMDALKFVRSAKFTKARKLTVELDEHNAQELDESAALFADLHGLTQKQAVAFVVNATLRLEG